MVIGKSADYYKLDIGAAQPALLGVLSFEGATKRNKPDHKVYNSNTPQPKSEMDGFQILRKQRKRKKKG